MPPFAPLRPLLSAAPSASAARTFSSTAAVRLARFNLIGRIGTVPELVTTQNGREIVKYSLGTASGSGENRTTSWWNIAFFGEAQRKDYVLNIPKG